MQRKKGRKQNYLRSSCVSSLVTARPQSEVRKWCSGLFILHVKSCMLVFIPPFDTNTHSYITVSYQFICAVYSHLKSWPICGLSWASDITVSQSRPPCSLVKENMLRKKFKYFMMLSISYDFLKEVVCCRTSTREASREEGGGWEEHCQVSETFQFLWRGFEAFLRCFWGGFEAVLRWYKTCLKTSSKNSTFICVRWTFLAIRAYWPPAPGDRIWPFHSQLPNHASFLEKSISGNQICPLFWGDFQYLLQRSVEML